MSTLISIIFETIFGVVYPHYGSSERIRIPLDANELETLQHRRLSRRAAAHETVQHRAAGRRYEAAQVAHQVRGLYRWVGVLADPGLVESTALGLDDASPADVAKVTCRLVDDLDALAESVGGGDDPASVVADLRRGIAELRAELRRERAGHLAVLDHLREMGGDLAVLRAQIDQGTARAFADAVGGAG